MRAAEKANFPEFEKEILGLWEKEQTFQKSLENRKNAPIFSFYDGPPFANGLPHYGHAVASAEKDAVTRYKTMRGYYVPRRAGWDTHGLPVEYEVEKQLQISGKRQILEMGIEKFNQACRDSVFRYKAEWEEFLTRFGRWIDLKDAYATLDNNYIESVWWVFSELYKKGLVYQGFKSMPYCPRCATPLSNFELNQGYQDGVEDPSVYVTFPLRDDPNTALLAWTTTPWTLPANAALAVDAKADYVTVQQADGSNLILAKQRLGELDLRQSEYEIIKTWKGKDLVGLEYEPLYVVPGLDAGERAKAYQVYADESVSLEDGTGILHVAPRYGEADLELGLKEGLPLIESVDSNGMMTELVPDVQGQFFKAADSHIVADLTRKDRIFAAEMFTHTYPFCWRCDTPLMYFATPSWFIRVTELVNKLVANNQKIGWVPEHVKMGRFGNWLAEARDWGVSRNRFWGAPLPIWRCDENHLTVVGSIKELDNKAIIKTELDDLHRPYIDKVEVKCDECGKPARRVEEVFDCWFESGSMPFAQEHYPFEHQAEFEQKFPAEFIAEGMDQTRGWFYTLHVLATALFDQPAFKHVVVNGIVVAADGKKLSKRLRNYPDIDEVFVTYGADSLRYFLLASPVVVGEDVRFSLEAVGEVNRNIFMTLWNVYSFLATYASMTNWQPEGKLVEPKVKHVLDHWILSRLNETTLEITKAADNYELNRATRPLRLLVDDLSNWYVRRSRKRFATGNEAADRAEAFTTLHYVLTRICQIMAPWAPFLSDKIYLELTTGLEQPASVHLTDWPAAGSVDGKLLEAMSQARVITVEALAQRAAAKIRVRQPLAKLAAPKLSRELSEIVRDEVNVKELVVAATIKLDTELTPTLKQEGLARDLLRHIQDQRKVAGLQAGDHIKLKLYLEEELSTAAKAQKELLAKGAIADQLEIVDLKGDHESAIKIAGRAAMIEVTKV